MSVRKLDSGKWLCECYPSGRSGRRVRKQFSTKGEAVAFEKHTMSETDAKPWLGAKDDTRLLSELIQLWWELHGVTLADGKNKKLRFQNLNRTCEALGDPIAANLTPFDISEYRRKRISGEIYSKKRNRYRLPAALSTINIECTYLTSVYNTLKKLGHIKYPNPIENVPPFRIKDKELSFLNLEEISSLLNACEAYGNADLTTIVKICLSTGCRWGEALNLRGSQVIPYKINFAYTKSGKNRSVPITKELFAEIEKKQGALFRDVTKRFNTVLKMANIELPHGQKTHVLRHTFASHFMMNNGNILVLRQILGHTDIKMTMIYAHFSPDHLEDATTKNPLSMLNVAKV